MLSLMSQYTPITQSDETLAKKDQGPSRVLTEQEYETVLAWLEEFGIEDGFYQQLDTNNDWLPDFKQENPFSSRLSVPVWHWKKGII
jgi:putative pyruvate formate lyase activating enzyme